MCNTPRIYIANLTAYNSGFLQGAWIDATDDIETIEEKIKEMLSYSLIENAEEYAIHDYENFGEYRVGEYQDLTSIREIACFIEEYPDFGSALINYFGNIDEAKRVAEENYCGSYSSTADYAQQLTEDATEIPAHLSSYINYESMARDMKMGGDILKIESGFNEVHIFWSR